MSIGFRVPPRAGYLGTARPQTWLLLCVAGLALFGCGQAESTKSGTATGATDSPEIAQARSALLTTNCTITTSGMSVAVDDGELAIITYDSSTAKVTLNANLVDGMPCTVASTLSITVTPGSDGDHSVLLDLSNGLFAKATSGTPKIKITLGSGVNDTLTIKGSAGDDRFYLGKGSPVGTNLINFNGGTGTGYDSFPDISVSGAETLLVNAGAGDDIIDASGLFGTLAPYPSALKLYGGIGNDVLTGGAGDDMLSGDAGNDQLGGGKGANTYACSPSSDGTDVITVTATAVDTVDYSQRFNPVSVLLNGSASSGESGEHDTIPDAVSVVKGGLGNDSISALGSALKHTLMGGRGDDTLTGGNGGDTLYGGDGVLQVDGDDVFIGSHATVNYSSRTQPITVTVNGSGAGGADANDGDPAVTRHAQMNVAASGGATITAFTNTVTGLTNMTTGSVGHVLVIAGSTAAHDNGSYHIVSVANATTVTLNASETAANAAWADDVAAAWSFSEDASAEKDEVRCPNVTGSASAVNTLTGDGNANWLTGGSAIDTLVGGAGNDTLAGLDAGDTLYGGDGDDSLIGGVGNDVLHGGDGNDVLEGDDSGDSFECDGKNDALTSGSAPGTADYTVDFALADGDTKASPSGCEY